MRSTHPVPRFTHMTILAHGTALPERRRGRFLGRSSPPFPGRLRERRPRRLDVRDHRRRVPAANRGPDLSVPSYLANAPDGSVLIADFREEFIAHGQNYQSQIDPFTGRIYRLRGKETPAGTDIDLSRATPAELVAALSHRNPWHRQTACGSWANARIPPQSSPDGSARRPRDSSGSQPPGPSTKWGADETLATHLLDHPAAPVRAWAIRLMGDAGVLLLILRPSQRPGRHRT